MRVIAARADAAIPAAWQRVSVRTPNIELLGLLASSLVVLLAVSLTYAGRAGRLDADAREAATVVQLDRLRAASELEPMLTMYEEPFERRAVARALYARVTDPQRPLNHVGGLAAVAIPAAEIRKERRFVELRSRLDLRPGMAGVAVLAPADLAAIKPRIAVRDLTAFRRRLATSVALFLGAFWVAHLVRRWRRKDDDPVMLPVLMMLTGLGLTSMIALRDPLRDTMIGSAFVAGIVVGLALLLAVSEIDFEASPLRRATLLPLAVALALAVLLLVFGSGPGTSGAKVNLAGVQPVEAIRLLIILALAAYFARRLDFLRELSEPLSPSRPWLQRIRVPRWKDVRPVAVSMALVLAFFFLQKDLGPALVMSCVFLGLFGIARGRVPLVALGFAILVSGFAVAYLIGVPATVRQRVMIWADPWNNGVGGGNHVAHGLWALSTGGPWGLGQGLGAPQVVPAGHTDFVLAAVGEELGFAGIAIVAGLYALLCWRSLRIALRAPGDYTAFLAIGITLALAVQALLIAGGLLGLVPLAGVVTPFLSYGKSSMLANLAAVGILLAIARRKGDVRLHLGGPVHVLAAVLAMTAGAAACRAMWLQVARADEYATRSSLGVQADGGYRFEYNPRLIAAARMIPRGSIYDRHGLPVATSKREEVAGLADAYRKAGFEPPEACDADAQRCYPLGGIGFHLIGDWRYQTNWGARNASYFERDRASTLQGYDDRAQVVEVVNPATGAAERTVRRDYREVLPLARNRYRPSSAPVKALLDRDRDVHTSIDARLQLRTAGALRERIVSDGHARGAAVVLDSGSGEVLAAVSYPWPSAVDIRRGVTTPAAEAATDRLLDRSRYGLYPPGSIFKLVVAASALRTGTAGTFACVRLPDGRVGNYVGGSRRPVRDDPLDTVPHGSVDLHEGIVVSCNAYFAQLASRLGPEPLLEASRMFQIDVARTPTPRGLQPLLPHAGYGQGEVVVSPLKMARVAAAIAAGGHVLPVQWERRGQTGVFHPGPDGTRRADPDRSPTFLRAADAALLSRHMREVVTDGTGRRLGANPTPIAGKTGTAEVARGPAHSWFVGFAPYGGSSRIAFAVIVENAGYGARTAAPIAGEIVTAARELGLFERREDSQ
jgi:cell division protein FtsW (lipid II flippase)/cell division protein FtsI/penicillin-binding protein 2